jgi:branched-chain amino acid transport system permease protein
MCGSTKLRTTLALGGVIAICVIAVPILVSGYWKDVFVILVINMILVVSYRLITTMGGWSFAHVVMMGLGGYASALLTTKFLRFSFWTALPLSGIAAAAFALLITYPVLRTRGFYFFLSTFAAGEALRQSFIRLKWPFGGIEGISFIKRPAPLLGIDFENQLSYYYLALGIAIVCGAVMFRFSKSRIGVVVKAVSSNQGLCEAVGVNTWGYKAMTFIVGSIFSGVAGSLFVHYNGFVAPTDYTSIYMFKIVASAILGGTTTFVGPIVGLIFLTLVQEIFRDLLEWLPLVYGAIIISVLLFLPKGIEGVFKKLGGNLWKPHKGR